MTDNELNALIAERVMGLENVRVYTGHEDISLFRIDNDGPTIGGLIYPKLPWLLAGVPDYCNDIVAAWQVALKVASMPGYSVVIHVSEGVWIEKETKTESGTVVTLAWQEVARVGVAGDARAICLAALKAVGVDVEG